ncbi:adenosine kinase [Babesia caballi]|uniref:Adenosine kinase n=1 Tax=Babesia caballi TaxID=5871 RepID=A0AAV4M4S6_BABCB|nr:adenosine kinase [Babesia caballi]
MGHEILENGPSSILFTGHPLANLIARVDPSVIESLNFAKGESNGITPETFKKLGERVNVESIHPGCSSSNSAFAYSYLGGDSSYYGLVGDDEYADLFEERLSHCGVKNLIIRKRELFTSQLYSLVTPDAERTMYLMFGASHTMKSDDLDESIMDNFDYYAVNGFMFADDDQVKLTNKMIDAALSRGKGVITFLANSSCVRRHGDHLKAAAEKSIYLTGNLEEFRELYGLEEPEKLFTMFEELTDGEKPQHKAVIITMGSEGAYVTYHGKRYFVPPCDVEAVDTTGAGDFFAGAFFYGLLNGYSIKTSSEFAVVTVGDTISRVGITFSDGLAAKIVDIKASA